ncbi:DUF305 domain-containing protein [Oceanicola sp. 502str15]|uniref:DUF305 domain-containing protein n=1 Tax=Oceanicola sp. 502str15 TaxID=2696061 RepID=UPI00209483DB|nr:DUF305 domain-containing protein [Oceanicola sp. 502str15]MCO6385115.1 DUF305 domain-containing protein [Oceanicola sp. 502str15]
MTYTRFAAMIATSTVVMFGLMYLNTYALEHVFFSETRLYMALLMGAVMAAIMLGFMWGMYPGRGVKLAILAGALVVFSLALLLIRSQVTVGGLSYMRAMIPHHSIAVMTSTRAGIEDARVAELAGGIAAAQRREIAEMRWLIAELEAGRSVASTYQDPAPLPGSVEGALTTLRLSTLHPAPLTAAQAAELVSGPTAGCNFRQTKADTPIFWTSAEGDMGVMLLNGTFLRLGGGAGTYEADSLRMEITPLGEEAGGRADAALVFSIENGPTRGYRGFWTCAQ